MENKEIKVSVVIPVYNTEKYVREAVESIMNHTAGIGDHHHQ